MRITTRRTLLGTGRVAKYRLVILILGLILLAAYIYALSSIESFEQGAAGFTSGVVYYVFQFVLVSVSLILIILLGYIIHYGFGAVARIERGLEDVAAGNYSFRVHLRKGDFLRPLAGKLNKVLDLLEKNAKK